MAYDKVYLTGVDSNGDRTLIPVEITDGNLHISAQSTVQSGTTAQRDAYFTDGGAGTAGRAVRDGDMWANSDTTPPTHEIYNEASAAWELDPLWHGGVHGRSVTLLSDISATGDGSLYKTPGRVVSLECVDTHDTSGAVSCTVTVYGTNETSVPTTDSDDYLAKFTLSGTDEVRGSITVEHAFNNLYAVVDAIGSANEGITLTAGV